MPTVNIEPFLTDDLRQSKYRGNPNRLAGHCYVACEVLYHLNPGRYKPYFVRHEGEPHWFLREVSTGKVEDPTASQFKAQVPYDKGIGKGFLTKQPSKRAQEVLRRCKLEKQTMEIADMDRKNNEFVGKTLREVKEMRGNSRVRVTAAGPVQFFGTADFRSNRLNVVLGDDNITFVTKIMDVGGEPMSYQEVEGNMDNGIVVEAWWG